MAPSLTIIHSRWQRLCRTSQQQHSSHEPATAIGLARPQYTRHRRIPPTPLLGKFFPLRNIRTCKKRQWKLIMIITTTERARASHHRAHSRSALEPGLETYVVRSDSKTPDGPGAPCETNKKKLINAIVIASNTSARLFNVLAIPRSKALMQLIRISLPLRAGDPRTSSRRQLKPGDFFCVFYRKRKKKHETTR